MNGFEDEAEQLRERAKEQEADNAGKAFIEVAGVRGRGNIP